MTAAVSPSPALAAAPSDARERPAATAPALEARGLTKRYAAPGGPVAALEALDLVVRAGEVLCLLGANGAGKTTTINCFLGFVAPTAGQALVDGLDVAAHPLETKRRLAYIPETVMLYRNLSGLENLAYLAELATGRRAPHEALAAWLREAGLDADAARRRVGTYSKGMRQKVGIALALAKGATALLLDEPTSGLDPKASNEFSALLARLSASTPGRAGAGILMATHDLFRAKESGTHVGIMRRGRLVAVHRTADLSHADLERLYLEHMRD
jgi:ABC-2 type transport system ATP-binding protein